ncbi:ACT domain-containing protein [bacterium]|nr:ACT domain-containing protein [bacterium]
MSGITDLETLLASMNPVLIPGEFVFVSRLNANYGEGSELNPIAAFEENEGLTLIVPRSRADEVSESYQGVFRMITLQVHSSLEAVGLTAAVADALAKQSISANVVAAFYHDHIFVPLARAEDAMVVLKDLRAT